MPPNPWPDHSTHTTLVHHPGITHALSATHAACPAAINRDAAPHAAARHTHCSPGPCVGHSSASHGAHVPPGKARVHSSHLPLPCTHARGVAGEPGSSGVVVQGCRVDPVERTPKCAIAASQARRPLDLPLPASGSGLTHVPLRNGLP